MKNRIWELIRLSVLALLGLYLMFDLQPWLFKEGIIPVNDVDVVSWVSEGYQVGATLVFAVSFISALVWYVLAMIDKNQSSQDVSDNKWLWYVLLFISVVGIFGGVYLARESEEARWYLIAMFGLNIYLVFWLGTAVSSPRARKFVPLSAFFFRRLFERG